jgi:predicted DNA-binding ribbon-helix-helix protein
MAETKSGGTTHTSIRIDTTIFFKLRRIAENENRSISNIINHISERYIFEVERIEPEKLRPKNQKSIL